MGETHTGREIEREVRLVFTFRIFVLISIHITENLHSNACNTFFYMVPTEDFYNCTHFAATRISMRKTFFRVIMYIL